MYYGNPSASAGSNGTNTFLFFDHFDDGSLTGWTTSTPVGSVTESGTVLTVSVLAGSNGDWWHYGEVDVDNAPICYRSHPAGDWIATAKTDMTTTSSSTHRGIMYFGTRTDSITSGLYSNSSYYAVNIHTGGGEIYSSTTQPAWLRIRKTGDTKYFDVSFDGSTWYSQWNTGTITGTNSYGFFAKNWGAYSAISVEVDYFFTRQYAATEPTVYFFQGEEEN